MFGFGFKSKVKKVLLKEFNYDLKSIEDVEPDSFGGQTEEKTVKNIRKKFDYEIRKIHDDSLNAVIEEAKNNYGNEYDAAIMFMIVQMNSLNIGSDDASNFVSENASNIRRIIPLSSHSEGEISSVLAEIQNKHENKDEETLLKQNNEFVEVFKEWVTNNKEESEKNDDTEFDTITYPDGSKYSGEFKDGMKNGKGIYTYPDGTQYTGEFKDNKFHGQGEITHFSGDNYKGEFMNGDRHGKGTHTYIGGGQYVGEFKNGLQHGQGTNTFNDGGKEVGEYFEGEPWNINGFDEDGNIFYSYVNGKEQE